MTKNQTEMLDGNGHGEEGEGWERRESGKTDRMSMANALFGGEKITNKHANKQTSSINLCINQKAQKPCQIVNIKRNGYGGRRALMSPLDLPHIHRHTYSPLTPHL